MSCATNEDSPSSHSLTSLGLVEFLEHDARPTFVLDRDFKSKDGASILRLVFSNEALRFKSALSDLIGSLLTKTHIGLDSSREAIGYLSWLLADPKQGSIWFNGLLWSSTCMQQRWLIVSGCSQPHPRGCDSAQASILYNTLGPAPISTHRQSHPTSESFTKAFGVKSTPHNLMVLGFDWSKTSIGSIESWPPVLRQMVPYLLENLQPGAILWGHERIMLYNEPYSALIKDLHPGALGASARMLFGTVWDDQLEPQWRSAEVNGAARYENSQIYIDRAGFLEETYFTYSLTPLWDAEGQCCGVDTRSFETTRQVVVEARMRSLLKISESAAAVTSLDDFWQGLVSAMASNEADFPLFAFYSLQDSDLVSSAVGSELSTPLGQELWVLRGSVGFMAGSSSAPNTLQADRDLGFAPTFRAVLGSSGPLVFTSREDPVLANLLQGCESPSLKLRCHQIVVCPLRSSSRNVVGFLVLGVNPSRPYDEEYKTFVRLLSRQIETSIAPIMSLVNEKVKSQIIAQRSEYEQQQLTTQLELQKFEARRSELRFLKFAEQAPLGVYILGADGGVKYANKAWFKMTGVDPDYKGTHGWLLHVHPDDEPRVDEQWKRLVNGYSQKDFEWRALKKDSHKEDEIVYLRASSFPELSADGTMKSVTGVLMDLSLERAQQRSQEERLKDALDAKLAQEYFIDMVSHEIRNPLHAILQLADETSSSLEEMKTNEARSESNSSNVRGCLENIHTIMYCGHHQKQILDDVLTLSKLNSNMLTLSLTEVPPISVVSKVLKFFDSDIRLSSIDISVNKLGTMSQSDYPDVLMDSGRVLQVLFNLVGNSIKFMKDRLTRKLALTIDMTSSKPTGGQLRYLPSGKKYADPTVEAATNGHKVVYIQYSVEDTGPGLTSEEMDILFERFKQVSPKTHTQYGGSGLGLFISRELAERHGGEIGLSSTAGQGSTFAFYVKCLVSKQEVPGHEPESRAVSKARRNGTKPFTSALSSTISQKMKSKDERSSRNDTTILIVEDNVINQNILDRQLRRLGYRTQIASNGQEALTILKTSSWWHESKKATLKLSIILCDLEMPVMDGLTCVRNIREWQRNDLLESLIPVVALTGNARAEQIRAAKEAGFDDVVSKPYTIQTLVSIIESMTRKT